MKNHNAYINFSGFIQQNSLLKEIDRSNGDPIGLFER